MKDIGEITYAMIEDMQHCIGFQKNKVTGTKHRVMHAYRNHFCTDSNDKNWNELVYMELVKQK